jgi:hypothetical protein
VFCPIDHKTKLSILHQPTPLQEIGVIIPTVKNPSLKPNYTLSNLIIIGFSPIHDPAGHHISISKNVNLLLTFL